MRRPRRRIPEEEEPAAHTGTAMRRRHAAPRTTGMAAASHAARRAVAMAIRADRAGDRVGGRRLVGVPHALGGSNRIEAFLEPASRRTRRRRRTRVPGRRARERRGPGSRAVRAAGGESRRRRRPTRRTELMLMGMSSGIALAGIGLALFFWLRNRRPPTRMARSFARPLHAAAEQVLRRRALRRGRSSGRSSCSRRGAVEGRRRGADRRHGQRRRAGSSAATSDACCAGCRPARSAPTPPRCSSAWC